MAAVFPWFLILVFGLLPGLIAADSNRLARYLNRKSFLEHGMVAEQFREQVSTQDVTGVVGGKADIPCDLTPPFPSDEPHLILFYKDDLGTPIYSYDLRKGEDGRHWRDNRTLGNRAFFQFSETGMRSDTGAKEIKSHLIIDPVILQDKGVYRCRVDFKEAPTKNTKIRMNLNVPPSKPSILSESEKTLDKVSEPVKEGSTILLICVSTGARPLPRLSWLRGHQVIDDVMEEMNTDSRTVKNILRLGPLRRSDHGEKITCQASNTNMTAPVSTGISINMVFPPIRAKIVREWSFFSVGKAYNVSCQVLGSRPPALTAIYVGSSQLREVNYQLSPDGNVSTTTVIFIPDESDQDKFLSCRAENVQLTSSAVEDQWKIQVHYPPRVLLKASGKLKTSTMFKKGDTAYLKCVVEAYPLVHSIEWKYNGKTIPSKNIGSHFIFTDDSLIIRSIQKEDSGVYQCTAKNQIGQGSSNDTHIFVESVPSCVNVDPSLTIAIAKDKKVKLECSMDAEADGPIDFYWSLNTSNDHVDIPRSQYYSNERKSVLTFTPKTAMDFGTIVCASSNPVGRTEKPCVFHIHEEGKPKGLRNCSTINQTFESLSILCTKSRTNSENQRYILEVFNSNNNVMVVNISTNQPVFHVQGLSAGTEYYVDIYSINDNGVSEHTIFETFTLQPAEKQLAATTTDLAKGNPMRLLSIVAVLVTIVLLLIILAVIVIIVLRGRAVSAFQVFHGKMNANTTANSLKQKEDEHNSPDLIPPPAIEKAHLYISPALQPAGRPSDQSSGIYKDFEECKYVELLFDDNCMYRPSPVTVDDTALYIQRHRNNVECNTHYATIDHGRSSHHKSSSRKSSRKSVNRSASTMHNARCPYKDSVSHSPSNTLRSRPMKRVAFRDEQIDTFQSSSRNVPSTLLDELLPAPPPGYESQPNDTSTEAAQEALHNHQQQQQQTADQAADCCPKECSPNNNIESML